MKKFFIVLLFLAGCVSTSYAASEDMSVYVRQDVFEAKMEAFDAKMDAFMSEIRGEFKAVNKQFEAVNKQFEAVNKQFEALNKRIDDVYLTLSNRIDDLKTVIYWGISILGLILGFAIFAPSLSEFLKNLRQPSLTVEDVKRLIAEAKLINTPQV